MKKKMFTLIGGLIVVSFLSGCANTTTNNNASSKTNKESTTKTPPRILLKGDDFRNGVLTDTITGVMWRRCALGRIWVAETRQCNGAATKATWAEMIRLIHNAEFNGLKDWRMPTASEYKSVIDATGPYKCQDQKDFVKKLFPSIFSPVMFGSNHWLADNSENLMNPISADMELIGMGCPVTETSLRPHAQAAAMMVRGGTIPKEWTFALSKMHLSEKINQESSAAGKVYWDGVGKQVRDVMTATSTSKSSGSYCSVSDTCFEVISTVKDKITIKCTKGSMIGSEKVMYGPNAKGNYAAGMLSGYHREFRQTGNFQCGN